MSTDENHSIQPCSSQKNDNSSNISNVIESGPSSLAYSGDNEEEYLRNTWQKLGVGHDGFLSLEELTKVCHAIGMEKVASEIIEQLFSRLDVDGDGRISFEEFLHMFKSGDPSASCSFSLDDSINQEIAMSTTGCLSSFSNNSSMFLSEFGGVFSSLDPEGTGFVSVSRIVEIWFSLGVSDGHRVLRDLGLPHRHGERIRVQDFSAALEEEWRPPQEVSSAPSAGTNTRQIAFLTLLHEIKSLRMSVESARAERDKYRWDLSETNHRMSLISQELEENNVQVEVSSIKKIQELEKCHREQLRELQQALSRERELARDQAESREILNLNKHLQQEENRLKHRIDTLEGDLRRLENENIDLNERLKESDHHILIMDRQIVELKQLKCKVAEFESLSPREEEYRSLLQRVDMLAAENQGLRDHNDELVAELDIYTSKHSVREKQEEQSLDGSCIGDYMDQSSGFLIGGVKRRSGTSIWAGEGGEESSEAEDESPRGKKVKKCNLLKDTVNIHYMDVTVYDESFDVSLPLTGAEKTIITSPLGLRSTPLSRFSQANIPKASSPLSSSSQSRSLPMPFLSQFQGHDKNNLGGASGETTTAEASNEDGQLDSRIKEKQNLLSVLEREIESLQSKRDSLLPEGNKIGNIFNNEEVNLDESALKGSPFVKPNTSTPLKQLHSPSDKCLQCVELENRLIVALEEAESALTQKDEETKEKIKLQSLLQSYRQNSPPIESNHESSVLRDDPDSCRPQHQVSSTSKARMGALEEHCKGLEGEVVELRYELITMVEERKRVEIENERLKNKILKRTQGVSKTMKRRCRDLTEKLKRKRMALASSSIGENTCFYSPGHLLHSRDSITTILEVDEPPEDNEDHLEDDEIEAKDQDGQICSMEDDSDRAYRHEEVNERESGEDYLSECTPTPLEQEMDILERELSLYEEEMVRERETIEKQKAALDDRCARLEQDLEISKSDVKKNEDYWLLKLKEEQDYYEEERKLYDENFSALEQKIREYEDVVLSTPGVPSEIVVSGIGNTSEDSDRLSTIDESVVWEKQVTELEEEVLQMKIQINEMQDEKEKTFSKLEMDRENALKDNSNLKQELESSKALLKTYETQLVATKEELELAHKLAEHKGISYIQDDASHDVTRGHSACQGSQFANYEKHIARLQEALKLNQKNSFETLYKINKMHKSEVQSLETRIAASEQMFTSTLAKYKDQILKASRFDHLVFELYMENAQLMKALELTEARQKRAEESNRRYELASLSSHSSL